MKDQRNYANISVRPEAHRVARVTKAKLGLTWSEFFEEAADSLDPDSND